MMFKEQIGKKMEVYFNDMLIKSEVGSDHVAHLADMFKILRAYCMKLNPLKCAFGRHLKIFWGSCLTNEE